MHTMREASQKVALPHTFLAEEAPRLISRVRAGSQPPDGHGSKMLIPPKIGGFERSGYVLILEMTSPFLHPLVATL